jgi:hypothetical protein
VDSYTVRLRRREQVGGKDLPEEVILVKFRKDPWSVHLKWLGPEGQGREAVYVRGQYGDQIHALTAPGGQRLSLRPDSPLLRTRMRHPITEAGLDRLIERFGTLVEAAEHGDPAAGSLRYLGPLKRPEFEQSVEAALQAIPPGAEPGLPHGGQRLWFFDLGLRLPVLVLTQDDQGHEVEYYCHDGFLFHNRLPDEDFNPDLLWRK